MELFLESFSFRATPAAQERASSASAGYRQTRKCLISNDFSSTPPLLPSTCLLLRRGAGRIEARRGGTDRTTPSAALDSTEQLLKAGLAAERLKGRVLLEASGVVEARRHGSLERFERLLLLAGLRPGTRQAV